MYQNKKIIKSHTLINCVFIAGILLIIVAYLIQINTTVSYSLQMKENGHELEKLQIQNENLLKQVAELSAIGNIYLTFSNLNMIETKNVDYVIPAQETLAGGY